MPNPDDFRDEDGFLSHVAYTAALTSWERVCKIVVEGTK